MTVFRAILIAFLILILAYTVATVVRDGPNLIPIFLGDILAVGWPGQFNLDFILHLWLGAIWVAWRHGFSTGGVALAIIGHPLGMIFFASYLLWASYQSKGDARRLVLGVHAGG